MEHRILSDDYMSQKINWKKVWLLFVKKIWMVLVITVLVIILAAGVYRVWRAITSEGERYVVSSDFYITFNEDENGVDYYNAYTWDSMLRKDPLVDEALAVLPEDYTKEEILASVTGEMPSDYRILTVYATHADPVRAETIASAYETAMELFANKLTEFEKIEKWSRDECKPVVDPDLTVNAAALGAVLGFVLALLWFAILVVLDDSIYVESDFVELQRRFLGYGLTEQAADACKMAVKSEIPFLGMITRGGSVVCKQEVQDNLSYLLKEKEGYYLVHAASEEAAGGETASILKGLHSGITGTLSLEGTDLDILRNCNGAIIMIPWGSKNGRIVEKMMQFLIKQDCRIAGAVVYNADDSFLRKYYNSKMK